MNRTRNARGCLLFIAVAFVAAPAAVTYAAERDALRPTPIVAAGVKVASLPDVRARAAKATPVTSPSVARPDSVRARPAAAERRSAARPVRDDFGITLPDGSYSMFHNY